MNTRRILITTTVICTGLLTYAQNKNNLSIETQGGYEYNYFRSPEEIRTDGAVITGDDLISSSFYQDAEIDYSWRSKWKNNRFRLAANPFTRIFYENSDDSYWSLDLDAKYNYKFNKNTSLFGEARFIRMNREGLGGDQDVLINPLGFTKYGGTLGIEFAPFTNNAITLEGFYNFKDFDEFGVRDLQYDEMGALLSSVQSFKVNRLKHKIGVSVYVKKRLYDTFNASDIEQPDGERDWDYLKGTFYYRLPFSKHFDVKPNFVYYMRIDNSTNRSGFNQFGPGLAMKYDNKKTKISGSFSFITRNYTDIEARDTDGRIGEKLMYEYTNFQLNGAQKIGGGFFITATVFSRIRNTNYTDIDARSFRSYKNQYAGFGILWEL